MDARNRVPVDDSDHFRAGDKIRMNGDTYRVRLVHQWSHTLTVDPTWWTRVKCWWRAVPR